MTSERPTARSATKPERRSPTTNASSAARPTDAPRARCSRRFGKDRSSPIVFYTGIVRPAGNAEVEAFLVKRIREILDAPKDRQVVVDLVVREEIKLGVGRKFDRRDGSEVITAADQRQARLDLELRDPIKD